MTRQNNLKKGKWVYFYKQKFNILFIGSDHNRANPVW